MEKSAKIYTGTCVKTIARGEGRVRNERPEGNFFKP